MFLFVVGVLVALIVSALCSLAEAVLLSLTLSQVADLSIKNPRVGQVWRSFKTNIERPIAFILILNTSAHTIALPLPAPSSTKSGVRKKPDSPFIKACFARFPLVADRLRTFIEQHIHIVAVKDEKGQILGLVTPEDFLEEVVGEVEDEFDRLPRDIQQVPPSTWIAGGGVPVSQVAAKLEISLPDPEGNLGRWLGAKLKPPYKPGQAYLEADHTFTVRRVRRGHIFDVIIQKQNPSLKA
jgi:CBS domain containing-hemolysin-like protein